MIYYWRSWNWLNRALFALPTAPATSPWAFLKVENCAAQRSLLNCGLDLATWERHIKMHPYQEAIIELDEAITSYPCALILLPGEFPNRPL